MAIGPWWDDAWDAEVDAVVLAGRERRPVAVMEAKWSCEVDARRLVERLRNLPDDVRGLTAEDVYG